MQKENIKEKQCKKKRQKKIISVPSVSKCPKDFSYPKLNLSFAICCGGCFYAFYSELFCFSENDRVDLHPEQDPVMFSPVFVFEKVTAL